MKTSKRLSVSLAQRGGPIAFAILMAITWPMSALAQAVTAPTPEQAHTAILAMLGNPPDLKNTSMRVGTCVKTSAADHKNEVSCTVAMISPGATSESQADFYQTPTGWAAEPSGQQGLPFPDPKLQ
jgi:hypothetical protein